MAPRSPISVQPPAKEQPGLDSTQEVIKLQPSLSHSRSDGGLLKGDNSEASQFLGGLAPFSQLPLHEIRALANSCNFATIASGDYIRAEGDEQPMGFIVVSGRFAMMKTSLDGKELVVELLPPGDIFGLLTALHKIPAQFSARAQIKSTVLWMPCSNLTLLLQSHPRLYEEFTAHLLRPLFSS
jgi:CRP-like cAMP-binding protein